MATEDDVRRIALSLPSTTGRTSYGTPGFRVQDRLFARLHDESGVLVALRSSVAERDSFVLSAPEKFVTDHYRTHAIVLVRVAAVGDGEFGELLEQAWETRASARLRQQHVSGDLGTLGT